MGFALFILVNVTLFIRPAEIVPALAESQIYLVLILACLVASGPRVLKRLSGLTDQPIVLCVLGIWLAAVVSHLVRADTYSAREVAVAFGKVVIYCLLLVSLVDSSRRLRLFLVWILVSITIMAAVAVLQFHGWMELPGMVAVQERRLDKETGEEVIIPRLCGSGIFHDPNDMCLALTMGVVIGLYWLSDKRVGSLRLLCLPALLLFGYTFRLTQSRGGLLGLLLALLVLSGTRFGWRKAILLALFLVPGALLLGGGRQTDFNLEGGDTGQQRVQIWSEGLALLRDSPLFGIGTGQYGEEVGHVAHNSFVHAFTEMGFVGGVFFTGAFYLALRPLAQLSAVRGTLGDAELARLQPFVLALVVGYAGGLWSLSRNYVEPTYLVLGVAQVYLSLVAVRVSLPAWQPGLLRRLGGVGAATLIALHLITRFAVRWG